MYLEILDNLTHDASHVPRLRDVPKDRRRQADEQYKEVGDRQINDEKVRYGPHFMVDPDDEADEKVADHSDDKYDDIETYENPLERSGKDELADHIKVILVADAIRVGAVGRLVVQR